MDETTNPADAPEVEELDEVEFEDAETGEEPELDDEGNPVEPEPEPEPEEDSAEIEYNGQKFKVPTALKDGFLMQADYTRKTQEVAEMRKAVEATLSQANEVSQAERQLESRFIGVEEAIKAYSDIDWQAWVAQDPVSAQQARIELDDLRNTRQQVIAQYQQAQSQRLALSQQETARRLAEGQRILSESIPDWGPEKQARISTFTQSQYGFSPDELNDIDDPRVVQVMHDAFLYRESQKKQAVAKKIEAAQAIKPVPTLKGNSGRVAPRADTSDFLAFEKLAEKKIKVRR